MAKKVYAECDPEGNFKEIVVLDYEQVISDEIIINGEGSSPEIYECYYNEKGGGKDEFYYLQLKIV